MSIIEELWYGNVSPCDAEIRSGSAYAELLGYDFLKQIFKNPTQKFLAIFYFPPNIIMLQGQKTLQNRMLKSILKTKR
jgi:hypothetical protein